MEGPGADACKPLQPSCASSSSDHAAAAAAVPASVPLLGHDHEEAETGVGEEMKERFLILGDMTSTASARRLQGGQQSQEWEARLKDAAAAAVPGMDGGQEAMQVSVWDAAPDPFFSPKTAEEEEGMGQQVFKVRIHTCISMDG